MYRLLNILFVYCIKLYIKIFNWNILYNVREEEFYDYIFLTTTYLFMTSINPIIVSKGDCRAYLNTCQVY